jgi:hypothetical protein
LVVGDYSYVYADLDFSAKLEIETPAAVEGVENDRKMSTV